MVVTKNSRLAFTLVELLVVIAIIGVLVALLLPAIQAAREAARRTQCVNNLKQLSLAHLNYENVHEGFVPMAKFWSEAEYNAAYNPDGPGSWYDDHGWYVPLMPYIEQANLEDLGDPDQPLSAAINQRVRMAFVESHACPSDIGLQRNEWPPTPNWELWARVRSNYVVNAGNTVYGQHDLGAVGSTFYVPFGGAPFGPIRVTPLGKITDGTANTLMMSEVIVLPETAGWGGPYSDAQTALGGQVFTGWQAPNSPAADAMSRIGEWGTTEVIQAFEQAGLLFPLSATNTSSGGIAIGGRGGIPTVDGIPETNAVLDSNGHKQIRVTARSRHPGGVNASRCDASVAFYNDDIDLSAWRALCTAWAGDLGSEAAPTSTAPQPPR